MGILEIVALLYEKIRGLDFNSYVDNANANTDKRIANHYIPTPYAAIEKVFDFCEITENDSILDYGCGKGGVLRIASNYPFNRIDGIELSDYLADIANRNMKRLHIHDKIRIYVQDARLYDDVDEYNYFYFFNPFPREVFSCVMAKIMESQKRKKRNITIIYYNPMHRDEIEKYNTFKILFDKKIGNFNMIVYRGTID